MAIEKEKNSVSCTPVDKSLANGRYLSQLRSYGFCIAAYEFKATALVTPAATFLPGKATTTFKNHAQTKTLNLFKLACNRLIVTSFSTLGARYYY
ncbi:hypothetical protein CEXT_306931 [Caerostris extrusa]|uniref:Uncharacterized protein n=1 Tax=Caerostris extrusa TaxID=172846 RepID=A0AAV4XVY0_CAEEX|nr:hypothetical protein CEXT_306931 [Caerostris extrusa]